MPYQVMRAFFLFTVWSIFLVWPQVDSSSSYLMVTTVKLHALDDWEVRFIRMYAPYSLTKAHETELSAEMVKRRRQQDSKSGPTETGIDREKERREGVKRLREQLGVAFDHVSGSTDPSEGSPLSPTDEVEADLERLYIPSLDKPFFFFHIPKTGGTSLREFLFKDFLLNILPPPPPLPPKCAPLTPKEVEEVLPVIEKKVHSPTETAQGLLEMMSVETNSENNKKASDGIDESKYTIDWILDTNSTTMSGRRSSDKGHLHTAVSVSNHNSSDNHNSSVSSSSHSHSSSDNTASLLNFGELTQSQSKSEAKQSIPTVGFHRNPHATKTNSDSGIDALSTSDNTTMNDIHLRRGRGGSFHGTTTTTTATETDVKWVVEQNQPLQSTQPNHRHVTSKVETKEKESIAWTIDSQDKTTITSTVRRRLYLNTTLIEQVDNERRKRDTTLVKKREIEQMKIRRLRGKSRSRRGGNNSGNNKMNVHVEVDTVNRDSEESVSRRLQQQSSVAGSTVAWALDAGSSIATNTTTSTVPTVGNNQTTSATTTKATATSPVVWALEANPVTSTTNIPPHESIKEVPATSTATATLTATSTATVTATVTTTADVTPKPASSPVSTPVLTSMHSTTTATTDVTPKPLSSPVSLPRPISTPSPTLSPTITPTTTPTLQPVHCEPTAPPYYAENDPRASALVPCYNCECACDVTKVVNQSSCTTAFLGHFYPYEIISNLHRIHTGVYGESECMRWEDLVTSADARSYKKQVLHEDKTRLLTSNDDLFWQSLDRSLCATVIRNPFSRSISGYYEFGFPATNLTATEYIEEYGIEHFMYLAGSYVNAQTGILGGEDRPYMVNYETLTAAKRLLEYCIVGVQEDFSSFVWSLSQLFAIPPLIRAKLKRWNTLSTKLSSVTDRARFEMNMTWFEHMASPFVSLDLELWQYAKHVAKRQKQLLLYAEMVRNGWNPASILTMTEDPLPRIVVSGSEKNGKNNGEDDHEMKKGKNKSDQPIEWIDLKQQFISSRKNMRNIAAAMKGKEELNL